MLVSSKILFTARLIILWGFVIYERLVMFFLNRNLMGLMEIGLKKKKALERQNLEE